jgi:long-chain acyl-CoA synthetase
MPQAGHVRYAWQASYPKGIAWDTPIPAQTLGALLHRTVAAHADRVALRFRDSAITYRDLGALAHRAAAALLREPRTETGIALLLQNSPWHSVAFFGAALAGRRLAHLTPLDPPLALARKLRETGARTLLTSAAPKLLETAQALCDQGLVDLLLVADDAHWGGGAPAPLPDRAHDFRAWLAGAAPATLPTIDPHETFLLQFTGGTTGLPKAAMLSQANLAAAAAMQVIYQSCRGIAADHAERVLHVLPLFHIYALSALNRYLSQGAEVVLRPRFDAAETLSDIAAHRIECLAGVPTMWIALLEHPDLARADLSSLRWCNSGGAALPVEIQARVERLTGRPMGGGWGMTETAPAGIVLPPLGGAPAGSIGLPLPGVTVEVVALDDPRRVLAPGETGELRIKGPNVFQGYWSRPDETAQSFVDGWFLTGDIGRMDAQGFFFLTDRKKDLIISGGFNVYPRAIEEALHEHPAIAECAVIGVPDAYRGQAAKAFIVPRAGHQAPDLAALRGFLEQRLGRHELPAALEVRAALPHTPVGKVAKLVLAQEQAANTPPHALPTIAGAT